MNNKNMKLRTVTYHFTGPAAYHHGGVDTNNTVVIPGIKGIPNVDCVKMWAPGLIVEPQSVSGPSLIYHVRGANSAHDHVLISKNGKGATAMKVAANVLNVNTAGGDNKISGGSAANGGIQNATAPALLAGNQGIVAPDDTNLSGITIYATVVAY